MPNCDENKDSFHMPLRILVQHMCIVSIVKSLSEQTSTLSLTFFALSTILQQQTDLIVDQIFLSAIRMTYSSRDNYFHTPNRNQTKLLPVEKY